MWSFNVSLLFPEIIDWRIYKKKNYILVSHYLSKDVMVNELQRDGPNMKEKHEIIPKTTFILFSFERRL